MPALSPRHTAFGAALRMLRTERGLSQEALGELAGISGNYVGDAERGERNVSLRIIWGLADALGVPAQEILRLTETHEATALPLPSTGG
ncbi:MAG TPA: helix-turn-helix transcriptional regulator [Solirubrobacteraceae bacterium]|jgi:transcriptional regulator with XRE-family HTH domain